MQNVIIEGSPKVWRVRFSWSEQYIEFWGKIFISLKLLKILHFSKFKKHSKVSRKYLFVVPKKSNKSERNNTNA